MRWIILIVALIDTVRPASAWDSFHPLNLTHSTHSHLTECGLRLVKSAELNRFRKALVVTCRSFIGLADCQQFGRNFASAGDRPS